MPRLRNLIPTGSYSFFGIDLEATRAKELPERKRSGDLPNSSINSMGKKYVSASILTKQVLHSTKSTGTS